MFMRRRVWLVGVIAAVLMAGSVAMAADPSGALPAGPGPGVPRMGGPRPPGDPQAERPVRGEVKAVSSEGITLTIREGDLAVAIGSDTTFDFGPNLTATLADVQVGDHIAIVGQVDPAQKTVTAKAIHILLPQVHGTVLANDGTSLKVKDHDDIVTVNLAGVTVHAVNGDTASSSITVGRDIHAVGRMNELVMTAKAVNLLPVHVVGKVKAKSDSAMTVATLRGDREVVVNADTKYGNPRHPESWSDIKVDDLVIVVAEMDGTHYIAAAVNRGPKPGEGRGPGRPGGPGPGGPNAPPLPPRGN